MWAPSSAILKMSFPLTIETVAASFWSREWAGLAHLVVHFPHMLLSGSRLLLCRGGFDISSSILKFGGISFTFWETGWRGKDILLAGISSLVMSEVDPLVYGEW